MTVSAAAFLVGCQIAVYGVIAGGCSGFSLEVQDRPVDRCRLDSSFCCARDFTVCRAKVKPKALGIRR